MLENINDLLIVSQAQETLEPYYEVLEYIQTSGVEYFDTGVILLSTSKVEMGITYTGVPSSGSSYAFGIFGNNKNFGINAALNANPAKWYGVWASASTLTSATLSPALNIKYDIEMSSSGIYINGTLMSSVSGTFTGEQSAYLMWAHTTSQPKTIGRIHYVKMYDNGVLVVDYIPVLDGKMRPCLYDRVSKTFLYAIGNDNNTITFKRWNKYDVDYIENTGTSYIPFADITPTTTMGMNIEYAYTVLSSSEPAGVIGTYNGDTQRKDTFFVSTSSGSTQKASSPSSASCGVMVFHRGGNVGTSSATSPNYIEPEKDVWYKATVNWLGDDEITWTDGTNELSTSVGANSVMTNQLRLFSRCNSSNNTYNNCKCRVRKLQFSDGSNIIRSYIPVVWHNSDTTAIATLYDEVYNKMCTPSGSLKAYITNDKKMELMSYTEGNTHGYYISATGVVTAQSESDYTDAIAVQQGDIVTLTTSTTSRVSNKRIHGYNGTSTNDWVQQLGYIAYSEEGGDTRTISVVVPSGISYIRISHSIYGETQCDLTITTTYECGANCSVQTATSNYFNSGLYGNEKWSVRLLAFTPTNTTGQLFGVVRGADYTENLTINSAGSTGGGSLSRFDSKVTTQSDVVHMNANQKSLLQINEYGLFQDSTTVMSWSNPDTFTTQLPCHICKVNGSTGIRPNGCCYLAIEEDNVLIAEFIPVRNATVTSEYGLYDRINGALNTGIGTITFNTLS